MDRVVVDERGEVIVLDGGVDGLETFQDSGAPDPVLEVGDPEFPPSGPSAVDQVTDGRDVLVSSEGVRPSHASQ